MPSDGEMGEIRISCQAHRTKDSLSHQKFQQLNTLQSRSSSNGRLLSTENNVPSAQTTHGRLITSSDS
jgi:hypothetical protein